MESIASLRQKAGAVLEDMEALNTLIATENRKPTDEEAKQFEGYESEVERIQAQIAKNEKLLEYKKALAQPVADGNAFNDTVKETNGVDPSKKSTRVEVRGKEREPGVALARICRAIGYAQGNRASAADHIEKVFNDPELAAQMRQLATTPDSAGGAIVPEIYLPEIIDLLRPASVVRASGARELPMEGGNLTVPKLTGGATANYVGENVNIPKSEQTFGDVKLSAKKLAALVPMSNELLAYSNPQADIIVRDDMIAQIAAREDLAFLRETGSATAPTGLLNLALAANKFDANATVNLANVDSDLGKAILNVWGKDVPMRTPGWIMNPRSAMFLMNLRDGNGNKAFPEMNDGRLRMYPFRTTSQIPINMGTGTNESEIYFADFAEIFVGQVPGFEVRASQDAAYHDGSAVVAAFSQDQTVIRAITSHDLQTRHPEAISVIQKVIWVP